MPNSEIFCNTPWYELHIYWDGSLGICCQESHRLYNDSDSKYNIASMTIAEWFNSDPVQQFRRGVLGNSKVSACSRCYHEEKVGGNSRRFKSNQKSVIFRQAFQSSFDQSPGKPYFDYSGHTVTSPIDVHIDLGNHCNLACKMCNPQASSKIAVQEVQWGIDASKKYVGTDWTRDQAVWNNFKNQLVNLPNLKNIHLMGGETVLAAKFEDLVDAFIDHKRFEVCFSFVTNGTTLKPQLIEKLKKFSRVGIEVSIETITKHNSYVRQGTDTDQVLGNIKWYQEQCNNTTVSVTLRPAIGLLTIGHYYSLLEYALANKFIIKSLLVSTPDFLNARYLPEEIKHQYSKTFDNLIDCLDHVSITEDYNTSDPNNYQTVIKQQALMCKKVLSTSTPVDCTQQYQQLVEHCQKWDQVYGHNARLLYPELADIWDQYGYSGSN
jgi:sulfatase maturation enzyme AslB (radical SAM superfamily)